MIKNFSYVFQNKTLTKTMYKYNYNYSKRTNKSQKIKQLSKKKDANHYSFIFNVSIVSIVISHNTNIKAGHATCKGWFYVTNHKNPDMTLEGYGGRALLLLIFSLYNCNIITSVNTDNMSVTITTTCKEKAIRKLAKHIF